MKNIKKILNNTKNKTLRGQIAKDKKMDILKRNHEIEALHISLSSEQNSQYDEPVMPLPSTKRHKREQSLKSPMKENPYLKVFKSARGSLDSINMRQRSILNNSSINIEDQHQQSK